MKNKTKTNAKTNRTSFPQKVKKTKADMKSAYDYGYRAGWKAHEEISKSTGTRTAVRAGFNNGLSKHKKADRYVAKANPQKAK